MYCAVNSEATSKTNPLTRLKNTSSYYADQALFWLEAGPRTLELVACKFLLVKFFKKGKILCLSGERRGLPD